MIKTAKKQPTSASWKKGQSGNPNGRPKKGYSITEWFKGMLDSEPEMKEKLGNAIFSKALSGDPTAMKLVWSYMDGMPQQKTDITTDGQPLPQPILGGLSNVSTNDSVEKDSSTNKKD